jgi:hypothetical protein
MIYCNFLIPPFEEPLACPEEPINVIGYQTVESGQAPKRHYSIEFTYFTLPSGMKSLKTRGFQKISGCFTFGLTVQE